MLLTRPSLDGQRSVSSALNQSGSGDDILSTIKPFLKRLEDVHALRSSASSSFDGLEKNVKSLKEIMHTIDGQVESLNNNLSSSYHNTVSVSAQVEHAAYDIYLASLGLLGAVSNDDLETIRDAWEFSQRLEKLQNSITPLAELQDKQNESIESYFTIDNMGNQILDRSKLREKIDSLQLKMELVFQRLTQQQSILSPVKTNTLSSTPTPSQNRRRSGGRTLRFIDEDEEGEDTRQKVEAKTHFPHSHSGDQEQPLSWLDTTLDAPQLSPLPSPTQITSKHYLPPSVMSRPIFLASKRRHTWQTIARTLHHELERPCLSFALFDTLTTTEAQLSQTSRTSHQHPSSNNSNIDQYNLARRKFAAVKATHWTDHITSASLNDQTLVGDLANLLSHSLHVQQPESSKLIQETNKPFSPLRTKVPVTIIPQVQQTTTLNTTTRMATLQANIDVFTAKKIVYTYKVKPPPPPPPVAALSQPPPPAVSTTSTVTAPTLAVAPPKPAIESLSFASKLSPAPTQSKTVEEEIRALYEKYNPSKINDIPALLEKNKGKEQALLEKIRKKYETVAASSSASVPNNDTNNNAITNNTSGFGASTAFPASTTVFGVATNSSAKKPMTVEEEIRALYEKYNPDKIAEVPALLLKNQGKEQHLLERIRKKYEPSGSTTADNVSASAAPMSATSNTLFGSSNTNTTSKPVTPAMNATNWLQPKSANPTPFSSSAGTTPATTTATKNVFGTSQGNTPFSSGTGMNNAFTNMGTSNTVGTPASGAAGTSSLFTPAKSPPANTLFSTPVATAATSGIMSLGSKSSSLFTHQASPATQFGAGWGAATQQPQTQAQQPQQLHSHNTSIQAQIEDIYRQHNPTKLAEVPDLLLKYSGRELELLQKMQKKYLSAGTPGANGAANSMFPSQTQTPVNRSVFASPMASTGTVFGSGSGTVGGGGLGSFSASPMPQSAVTPFSNTNNSNMGGGITFGGGFGSSPGVATSLFKR